MSKIKPEQVFTPRSDAVYPQMYISRPDLEESLLMALRIPKHIIIHGESGSGKSWLYKNVFKNQNIHYEVVNLGRAKSLGSIGAVIEASIGRMEEFCADSYTETKEAKINAAVASGKMGHEKSFSANAYDPFEKCLRLIREKAKGGTSCLIFENLEQITDNEDLVAELSSLIVLVDDGNYSKYNVKILIVGTSNDIRSYISKASKSNTITNRLNEIPEVSRLTHAQASTLILRGFLDILKFDIIDSDKLTKNRFISLIIHLSDKIPQYLQDCCLHIALYSESNDDEITYETYVRGVWAWIKASLVSELSVVENSMNSKSTKIGRKNQIIYAASMCTKGDFNATDIELIVRREFPISCKDKTLNVGQLLSELASSKQPMIRKTTSGTHYRFIDPKIKIVTRSKITKIENSESLELREFGESISWMN